MKNMQRALLALAVPAVLVGCGSEEATPVADSPSPVSETPTSFPEPEGLTCPSDIRVSTEGGLLTEFPEGADTPEEAVEARSTPEEPWVLVGKKAYVLREDGTAYEVHDVVKGPKGWFLHGYEACADGS